MAKKKSAARKPARQVRGMRLVNAYMEDVSAKVITAHRRELKAELGQKHGIYALYRREKQYYVGLAKNLFSRLSQHTKDRHKRKWDRFSAYITRREQQVRELESLALRILVPKGNRVKGRLREAEDAKRSLELRIESQHDYDMGHLLGGKLAVRAHRKAGKAERGASLLAKIAGRRRPLRGWRNGEEYDAVLLRNGMIRYGDTKYDNPRAAAVAATGQHIYGWAFWHYREKREWRPLLDLKPG